jgi:hypothetical protein
VKAGRRARLWLDTRELHVFDASEGLSPTRAADTVGAVV